jgi:glycosyltransferase involved in cell wall biosynthesis
MEGHVDVSVCCSTFNHEPYIESAISGFLAQKVDHHLEIIIRDDASVDGTAEILKQYKSQYPQQIRLVLYDNNQYSLGRKPSQDWPVLARGKYYAICEGDDYWTDPRKLQKQVDYLNAHPDCAAVTTYSQVLGPDGIVRDEPVPPRHTIRYSDIMLGRKAQTRTATLVYRANAIDWEAYDRMGSFHAGDRKLKLALTMPGGYIQVLPFQSAVYRHHAGGMWSLAKREVKRANIQHDYLETHRHFPMSFALKLRYVWHHFLLTLPGDLRYGRFRYLWQTLTALRIRPDR